MSYYKKVMEAANQRDALLAIGAGIDEILDRLDGPPAPAWDDWGEVQQPAMRVLEGKHPDDPVTVELAPPDDAARARRSAMFDEFVKFFVGDTQMSVDDFERGFIEGGVPWLHACEDDNGKSIVMQMSTEHRQRLFEELLQTDPRAAHEFGRDVLRADTLTQQSFARQVAG